MKVGEGGFGCVYRGLMCNTIVAIKMLRSHNLQGQSQFRQEVIITEELNYATYVAILGY
jgi:hypothetical protein